MGQYVTALGMGLRALEESHPDCPQLRHLRNLTEVMGRDIHRLALELRPAALDDLGLATAIQNYLEDWTERSGVEIDYLATALESGRLPAEVEMAAYRIIQETLTNIVRHAEAKQVSVVIGRLADHLHLAVEDDGKGFDVEGLMASPEISQRLGLLGMHERIAQLKGVLSIESTPGKGTAVLARIPLNRDERSMDNEEAPRFSGR
jgi:signal transduction histidine kinase